MPTPSTRSKASEAFLGQSSNSSQEMHFGARLAIDGPSRPRAIETSKIFPTYGARSAAGKAGPEVRTETEEMLELLIDSGEWFDQNIESRVASHLGHYHATALRSLRIKARRGVVTLQGQVETYPVKRAIVGAARRVPGVAQVIDELSVTGISPVHTPMRPRYHFSAELVRYFEERRQGALNRRPDAWVA
jgi:hypothetical protein